MIGRDKDEHDKHVESLKDSEKVTYYVSLYEEEKRKNEEADKEEESDEAWEPDNFNLEEALGNNTKGSNDHIVVSGCFKKNTWIDKKFSSEKSEEGVAYLVLDRLGKTAFLLTGERKKDKGKFSLLDREPFGCLIAQCT